MIIKCEYLQNDSAGVQCDYLAIFKPRKFRTEQMRRSV